jgi:hypothetical protein
LASCLSVQLFDSTLPPIFPTWFIVWWIRAKF